MSIIGIYKITSPSEKVYIGKTTNIVRRKNRYKNLICTQQSKIYNSLKKYGWDKHIFEIIEECLVEELTEKEIFYKQKFIDECGWDKALFCYIRDDGGDPLTQETKDKISKAKKGHSCFNNELRGKKIKLSLLKLKRKCTEESKQIRSEKMKGRKNPFTQEHINNLGVAQRKRAKNLLMYNFQGEFIKKWESKGQASKWIQDNNPKALGQNICSQIKDCCMGRMISCWGYIWRYEDSDLPIIPKFKTIYQFNLNKLPENTFTTLLQLKEWLKDNRPNVNINSVSSNIKRESLNRVYKSGNYYYSINKQI